MAGARWRKYAHLALEARSAVRRHRPDVVWGHYLVPTGSIARRGELGGARPLRADRARHRRHQRRAFAAGSQGHAKARSRDACAVFAVSDDLADRLEAMAGPLGDRLLVVSAGVDLEAFVDGDAAVAAAALGWDSDGPRVAFVANLIPRKNVARLLAAFASGPRGVGRRLAGGRSVTGRAR